MAKRSTLIRGSFCCLALVATATIPAAAGNSAIIRTERLEFTGQASDAAAANTRVVTTIDGDFGELRAQGAADKVNATRRLPNIPSSN